MVLDTRRAGRQLIFTYGRPQGPISRGVTEAVGGMRQGGRRVVVVPPELGFGDDGQGSGRGGGVEGRKTSSRSGEGRKGENIMWAGVGELIACTLYLPLSGCYLYFFREHPRARLCLFPLLLN